MDELRREVRALRTSIDTLREDDMREVYGDQIKPILIEKVERFASQKRSDGRSDHEEKQEIRTFLIQLVESVISAFQREGKKAALSVLHEIELGLTKNLLMDDPLLSEFIERLVKQIKDYLDTSDRVLSQTNSIELVSRGPLLDSSTAPPSSTMIESALSPLSNAWRIDLLNHLLKGEDSLADLSRALNIKKGHLQFHLRSLLDSGLIRYDRKSHQYSITDRGIMALEGVTRLVERILSQKQ